MEENLSEKLSKELKVTIEDACICARTRLELILAKPTIESVIENMRQALLFHAKGQIPNGKLV